MVAFGDTDGWMLGSMGTMSSSAVDEIVVIEPV